MANTVSNYTIGTPAPPVGVPNQFSTTDWSLSDLPSASGGTIMIDILNAPANNGSILTANQYQLNGGEWVNLPNPIPHQSFTIVVPPVTLHTISLRAVNAVGAGPTSETKQIKPTVTITSTDAHIVLNGGTHVISGMRVTTFEPINMGTVTGVTIDTPPAHGRLTVNPDNTLALVLTNTNYYGALSFGYTVTRSVGGPDVETANLDVNKSTQDSGWGIGDHYMLETDANGDLVVEHGDNHRKIYISGSVAALSRADIAVSEGLTEAAITTSWLIAHPEYGGSEGMALTSDIGMEIWYGLSGFAKPPNSNWLLLERGYVYAGLGRIINPNMHGESELHPMHITSWGVGDQPIISDVMKMFQDPSSNAVFTNLDIRGGVSNLSVDNTLFSDVSLSESGIGMGEEADRFTLHDSVITDTHNVKPDGEVWSGTSAGIFLDKTDGVLIEGTVIHHSAWQDDYLPDGSTLGGQPPTQFSHNVYLQNTTSDVTFRNNIISQGSSFGAQFRGGAFVEDNVFLDNNVATNFLGGEYYGVGPVKNFTLFTDNVVTSAGYKRTNLSSQGALDWGVRNEARQTTLLDNIIAHEADPNNPDEIAFKTTQQNPNPLVHSKNDPFFNDTKVFNWNGFEANLDGLDPAVLNQTTIQNFALGLLGSQTTPNADLGHRYQSGLIVDLMNYLKSLPNTPLDDTITARDIIAYFQSGFGVPPSGDGTSTSHQFIPNILSDGVRWDNRLNWSNNELPTIGDSVALGGNWVNYGARTTSVASIDLGSGGTLRVSSGKLTSAALVADASGNLVVTGPGQFWLGGYSDTANLILTMDNGRFVNTGVVTGPIAASISGGQAILATGGGSYLIDRLTIVGTGAKIGYDGESGSAAITMNASSVLDYDLGASSVSTIKEFRSGAYGATPNVASSFTADGTLNVDMTAYTSGAGTINLVTADTVTGTFDTINYTGTPGGLTPSIQYTSTAINLVLA